MYPEAVQRYKNYPTIVRDWLWSAGASLALHIFFVEKCGKGCVFGECFVVLPRL